jgi:uncharacterized membrane protein YkvA (DUF1232 family)
MAKQESAPRRRRIDQETAQSAVSAAAEDLGFFRDLWHQIRLVLKLIRDPQVPLYLKGLPFIALLYVLVPTDLLPDLLPGLGQMDDLMALMLGAKLFIELSPQEAVGRHLELLRQQRAAAGRPADAELQDQVIIEGEFEDVDRPGGTEQ